MNKRLLIASFFLFFTFCNSIAQPSWQWGKRCGSTATGSGGGVDETAVDMATDTHGNVYVLSYVLQAGLNADGHALTGYGYQDILITSFRCDGSYRWSKDIGGGSTDIPYVVKTDAAGGVYVAGYMDLTSTAGHISTDTSIGITNKSLFLVKFDTAGTYQWLRLPEPDTIGISTAGHNSVFDMDVNAAGDIYMLCLLNPGAYAGGACVVPSVGQYVLQYDRYAGFIGATQMQITISGTSPLLKMRKDFVNGKYYITGTLPVGASLSFGATPVTRGLYIGCFSGTGAFLWHRQNKNNVGGGPFSRPDIDPQHNVYIVGSIKHADTFNTYVVSNPLSPFSFGADVPMVVKMDTNGTNIWVKSSYTDVVTSSTSIVLNGAEAVISGSYPGKLVWPGTPDSVLHDMGCGSGIFINRFSTATGGLLGMDTMINSCGSNAYAAGIAADRYGNVYIGGAFENTVAAAGTTLATAGGGSDIFVAKYGTSNCSLVPAEIAMPERVVTGNAAIHVYPNPATGELNIAGVEQVTGFRLMTMTGTTLKEGTLQVGANSLQMANYAPGMYILELNAAGGQRNIVRVVKQ